MNSVLSKPIFLAGAVKGGSESCTSAKKSSSANYSFYHTRLTEQLMFYYRKDASPVKVYGETTLIFPLLVAETFARSQYNKTDWMNGETVVDVTREDALETRRSRNDVMLMKMGVPPAVHLKQFIFTLDYYFRSQRRCKSSWRHSGARPSPSRPRPLALSTMSNLKFRYAWVCHEQWSAFGLLRSWFRLHYRIWLNFFKDLL